MEIKRLLCGLGCLCLLSGCSGTGDKSHSNADLSQVITSSQGNNSSAASEDDNQSTPEKARLEFCEAFNKGDLEKTKTLMPQDFIRTIEENQLEYFKNASIEDDFLPDFMRGVFVDKFVQSEEAKDPRMLEYFPDSEKVLIYYVNISVPSSDNETTGNYNKAENFGLFACALQNGKWYVAMNEDEWK